MKLSSALTDSCEHVCPHPLGKPLGVGLLGNVEIPPATARFVSSSVKFHFSVSPEVGSFRCPASTDAGRVDVFNGTYVVRCLAACSFMLLTVQ